MGACLERPDDLGMLVGRVAGGGSCNHRASDVGRIGGIHDQGLAEDRDVVPEHGRHLVGVPGAAD